MPDQVKSNKHCNSPIFAGITVESILDVYECKETKFLE